MSNAIGLRFYRVTLHEERSSKTLQIDDPRLFAGQSHLLSEFMTRHESVTNVDEAQRGWFFYEPNRNNPRDLSGRITYGIHGITSRFVDIVDRKEQFQREANHLEEIPLYFRFYRPEGEHYMIFAFQSYGVRSCIALVQSAFRNYIRDKANLIVRYKKLMPAEAGISPLDGALVKEMTLIKRNFRSDKTDSYRDDSPTEYDVKVSLTATGKNNFGIFRDLTAEKVKKAGYRVSLLEEFDKATVKVSMNGTSKHVTMFGDQGEAGTIDITDDEDLVIENGHPTQQSMDKISGSILEHFNHALLGFKK